MGAPSIGHEARVAELESLATLAGFTTDVHMPWRLRPDVARICPSNGAVLLGDGKDTEDPRCAATLRRLRWYGIAIAAMPPSSAPVTLALAVPAASSGAGWARTLILAVRPPMLCDTPSHVVIDGTMIVAATMSHLRLDRSHPYCDRLWPPRIDNVPSAPSISSAGRAG